MEVRTSYYTLLIDDQTGALRSLRGTWMLEQELLSDLHSRLPLFAIEYLDEDHHFHMCSSEQSASCQIQRSDERETIRLQLSYEQVGDPHLDVLVTIRCPVDEALSYWSLTLKWRMPSPPVTITSIHFPFVVVPYRYEGQGPTHLLHPFYGEGVLHRQPRPEQLQPDTSAAWRFSQSASGNSHYPGCTFAQFLTYYTEQQGLYLGCHDARGHIKIIKAVHREAGIRLGLVHVVGWDQPGEHTLGYEVAVGVFRGDWYDAADLYRQWYEREGAHGPRLQERNDVPSWLLDSPLHVVLRIQGELDAAPAAPNREFVPYENALPLLEKLSEKVDAPLMPIIMSWERPGPWVYPDSFPVAGGEESLRHFTEEARRRGWHIGTYCNGTRWVLAHYWTGYDGQAYYRQQQGEKSVCRLPDGSPLQELWDRTWRPSYLCCVGAQQTQQIAEEYVGHLLDLGLDWIQFLDQNLGAASYPCFSPDHGHAPAPGRWMTAAMISLLTRLEKRAAASGRAIVFSVESPPNDVLLTHFAVCDSRPDAESSNVPLYQYLYHEYILVHFAFAPAPDPYWMQINTARSFVLGSLLTAIMGPRGRLMAWAGRPWASWQTPEGDQEGIHTFLRRAIALRRGLARDFLVFGRMCRPAAIGEIKQISWLSGQRLHCLPAVFHARWRTHDGRMALALANWTAEEQLVHLDASQLTASPLRYSVQSDGLTTIAYDPSVSLTLVLPPLSVGLLEYEERK